MKRRKLRYADHRNVQACIDQLMAVVEGLRAGELGLEAEGQAVVLRPKGTVDFELRVEQLEKKETLRLELSWRPSATDERSPARGASAQVVADAVASAGRGPLVTPPAAADSAASAARQAIAEYQRLYAEACTWSSDGQRRVDQERLIQSLVRAGVDPLTQQELYSFALQADADGHTGMLSERMLAALERASQRAALASS